ncbi:response regulator [Myroides guanonis]|uniref:Two component transcriptional regulator, LuxR family n=1 Tax=Myroides guanonis TaxID=1150112 RepID=A0A1I3M7D3_9FLAO|nr:response regulator transcription factor [Myroides guanonis]SFI92868.1 two component transcriptional regulator, LuxR family [Myroides guanonis]
MIQIALADDHTLFRKSLKFLIDHFDNMEVVLEAENGLQLLRKVGKLNVDVVLLDLQMPVMDGFETGMYLREFYPDIKIVVLTLLNDKDSIQKIMHLGADGYLTKKIDPHILKKALESIFVNGFYLDKDVAHVLANLTDDELVKDFTLREVQIIRLSAQEFSAKEIAVELGISIRTVEAFRGNLICKTNSKNFVGVVLYALRHRIIEF